MCFFLQEQIEQGVVLLDATGQTIDEILGKAAVNAKSKTIETIFADEVLATKAGEHLNAKQREGIHHLFSQGVKHKMRMNILRQVSKTSEFQVGRMTSREGEDPIEEDENEGSPAVRKISTASIFNMVSRPDQLLFILLSPVA